MNAMALPAAELFRSNLRLLMVDRGLTITALADQLETSRPRLSRVLSGDEGVSIEFADKVAKHFGVTLSDFLNENLKNLVASR
jgi:transcriptional regulator with XRE-family HTH domain